LKKTPSDHPDFKNLTEALAKIKDINKDLNISIEINAKQNKVLEIQEKIGIVCHT
jgi:hypothetical protein